MNNKISVVMSVYYNDNAIHFEQAVESLLNQTYKPSEIVIVVDGCVSKELEEVIKKYNNNDIIIIIKLSNNQGLANALNIAIRSSSHELIARMDSDDICFKDRFEKQMKFLIDNDLDFVGGQMIEFGKNLEDIVSYRRVPLKHEDIIDFMKYRAAFSHPTILFKKKVFKSLKGYDINIFPEDYDFFVRVYLGGFKMGNIDENVLWFRLGENLSEAIKRRWGKKYAINEFKLYKKFLDIGFYSKSHFIKAVLFKIPLRFLPFKLFKFLYFKLSR
ncbi:glycosyl transferase family 2 [Tenacibaculum adriaticum]|uniref:Glycosyl transferase family 2 n=1 Tax=Tenacibaculum adriaticum TaxID=413713 RepID=A0A5S5DR57_9FLAO|nr:glycosyltransferase [Tenacibaculum adriaticum]TYP97352.1 glycosyl transferase family 2 [Tenacibaculum adriaticum]